MGSGKSPAGEACILDDPDHSANEAREIIIGYSHRRRFLLVSFTDAAAAAAEAET